MKIVVDVELHESELQSAGQVQQLFQGYCDQINTKVFTDRSGLAHKLDSLVNEENYDAASDEVIRRLQQPALFDDCVEVICALFFSELRMERGSETYRYTTLLRMLPDSMRGVVKDSVVQMALHILATPRRLDADRAPLIPVCETVAWLVKTELLAASSAILACSHLLRDDSTRCAAITCLGKLVEVAFEQIAESCGERELDELRTSLAGAQNDCFAYDVEYIAEPFGWSAPATRFATVTHLGAYPHHESSILAMAYSTSGSRDLVVTSSADGVIATWDGNGKGALVNRVVLARHYAAALDIANRGRLLLVAGNGRDDSRPAIIMYDSCWSEHGAVEPEGARAITAVKSVRGNAGVSFCCAATGDDGHQIHLYDAAHCTRTNRFVAHSDIVTALHAPADRDNLILSASRDCTVACFDLRKSTPVSQNSFHFRTVTCLGMYGDYVVSGGLDRRLVVSDLRMPSQQLASRDMESALLSISVAQGTGTAAVGTMSGLHMASLSTGNMFKIDTPCAPRYNSLFWNSSGTLLFCGGDTSTLDVYSSQ